MLDCLRVLILCWRLNALYFPCRHVYIVNISSGSVEGLLLFTNLRIFCMHAFWTVVKRTWDQPGTRSLSVVDGLQKQEYCNMTISCVSTY